ncbi:MAG: GGDEF domain-containing protein [Dehalococcoidia bacterium]
MRPATFALWFVLTLVQAVAIFSGGQKDILVTLFLTTALFVGVHVQFWYEESDQGARLKRSLDKMRGSIYEDDLTGLPNSRHFVFELRRQMMRSVRNGRGFSLVLTDLQGIDQRDMAKALPAVGKALRRAAGEGDFVAHLEGPVFATLVVEDTGEAMADRTAATVRLLESVIPEGRRTQVQPVASLTSYQGELEVRDFLRRAQRDLAAARERNARAGHAPSSSREFSAA